MSNRFIRDTRSHDSSPDRNLEGLKPGGSVKPHFRSAVYDQGVKGTVNSPDLKQGSNAKRLDSVQIKEPAQPLATPNKPKLVIYGGWTSSSMHVKKLPFYHPLEDFHRIFEKSKLDLVTVRLQDMFQMSSVCVKYDDGDEARSASAECSTLENSEFVVVFWSRDDKFIAEVQRTKGDSQHFYQYAQRVLDAVDGNKKLLSLEPNDPLDLDVMDFESEQQCMQTVFSRCIPDEHLPSSIEDDIKNSVDMVARMFSTDRYDSLRTGLESLKSMTNVRTSGCRVAKAVAASVLNSSTIITQKVTSLAAGAGNGNSFFKDLEFCALTILGQSVNLVDEAALEEFARLYPGVIQSLLVGAVHANSHIAYLSTHTLSVLHAHVAEVAELPVKHMQLVGATSHAALANASGRLMQNISMPMNN